MILKVVYYIFGLEVAMSSAYVAKGWLIKNEKYNKVNSCPVII